MEVTMVKPFLGKFYGVASAYVEGENPATTFYSCGAILLASVLAETRSVDALTEITGFPAVFVEVVLHAMETSGYHVSLQFADLIFAAHLHSDDFRTLETTVDDLMESYWSRMDPVWCDAFEALRGGYLFGGRLQWWVDTDQERWTTEDQWIH